MSQAAGLLEQLAEPALPHVIPMIDAIIAAEAIKVEAAFFGDGVAVDEPTEGGGIIPEAIVNQSGLVVLPLGGETEGISLRIRTFAAEQIS